MGNDGVSRADYSALLDRYQAVLSQLREVSGDVADSNGFAEGRAPEG